MYTFIYPCLLLPLIPFLHLSFLSLALFPSSTHSLPPSLPPSLLPPLFFLLFSEDGPQPEIYEAPPEPPPVIQFSPSGPPVPSRGDRPPQPLKPRPRSFTDDRPPIPTPPNPGPSPSGSHNSGPSLSPPPLPAGTVERTPSPPVSRKWRQSSTLPPAADKQQGFGPRPKSPRVRVSFYNTLENMNTCI